MFLLVDVWPKTGYTITRKETDMPRHYNENDEWKYNFYVVNQAGEFVYGFDIQQEAQRYAREHNEKRHRREYKCIPLAEAMQYSTGLTPDYEAGWSSNWKEPNF